MWRKVNMKPLVSLLLMLSFTGCTLLQPLPEPDKREVITTPDAPSAIGPYSQAIKVGNVVYCSGQLAINPKTGDMVIGDVKEEARQALKNLGAILQAAGMTFDDVVKATVFLSDIDDYKLVNEVYAEFFATAKPAREAVQVAALPLNAKVEISCIAVKLEVPR